MITELFTKKRIEKLEEELEDERRISLTEKDLFLSKINELENALKSRVQPQVYFVKTHSQNILYLQAPPFKPITVTTPNEAPKSTVKIVEIFPEKDSKRFDENDKSSGPFKRKISKMFIHLFL